MEKWSIGKMEKWSNGVMVIEGQIKKLRNHSVPEL